MGDGTYRGRSDCWSWVILLMLSGFGLDGSSGGDIL